jgi:two-component system, NarL family, response regulator DesR
MGTSTDCRALRLLVVDDHAAARGGLRLRLSRERDLTIVGEAAAAAEALALAASVRPDVILIDVDLPDGDGIDLLRSLRELLPAARCVILTLDDTPQQRRRALSTGAIGFVGKHEPTDVLLAAIRG